MSTLGPVLREALELVYNRFITHLPVNALRLWWLRRMGADLGPHVYLFGSSEVLAPQALRIAGGCHVGRHCQIDARGGISLGHDVVIASHCLLITADHDPQDPGFAGRQAAIQLGDRVWVGSRVTILKGVTVGEGAVLAAGAVVDRDVPPWTMVGGIPAKKIGERSTEQSYTINYGPKWY